MTQEQITKYQQAAKEGSLPPEENPLNLFATTSTNLLAKVLAREFNVLTLVRMEMRKRGVNDKGQWIGFEAARQAGKPASGRK
ncbi:hypothetical protein VRU48_14820 [Pedobacter sp. KR3-3]|uniref:Uncharacterized protein n=1 Tax=Pedobacter albus TaxID=3113905 RepID=A0ABU7IA93_9SPHI|nr:hypothetical protein [Pedobacter sp. KR3-3]MEE1946394.1 hypothetical protein [Pedobacter sp. KR3-3]